MVVLCQYHKDHKDSRIWWILWIHLLRLKRLLMHVVKEEIALSIRVMLWGYRLWVRTFNILSLWGRITMMSPLWWVIRISHCINLALSSLKENIVICPPEFKNSWLINLRVFIIVHRKTNNSMIPKLISSKI